MAGERRYTRIPPEGTGDRIQMKFSVEVGYINRVQTFVVGAEYDFTTSGFVGILTRIRQDTSTTGSLVFTPSILSEDNNITPSVGEPIELVGNGTVAEVSAAEIRELYTPVNKLVGWTDSYNGLEIDSEGSAQVRFAEGPASLDGFGKLRVSNSTVQGNYSFPQGISSEWSLTTAGAGSLTYNANGKNVLFSTGASSGDVVQYQTDQYHHYIPGISQTTVMTVASGDAGKAGVVREWGYFDDENGMGFRLNGTQLSVFVRSTVSGTTTETVINQNDWDKDTFNGSGDLKNPSGFEIDITAINIFWMDIQWLGGGRARFGVYEKGLRRTVHEYYHANLFPVSNMQRGSLPVTVRQENTGAAGSTSELKFWCCGVLTEGTIDLSKHGGFFSSEISGQTSGAGETYIGAVRPIANHPSGDLNHNTYFPYEMRLAAWDTTAGAPAMVKISIYGGSTVTTPTWSQKLGTNFESDTTGTFVSPGLLVGEFYVNGADTQSLADAFSNVQMAVRNKANGTQTAFYFTATRLFGANDVEIAVSIGIREITV